MVGQIICLVLSVTYALLSIVCIVESLKRSSRKEKATYLPTITVWIGALCTMIFLVIGWMASLSNEGLGLTILFSLFVLLGMYLMVGWKNCWVTYDKKGFTQKTFFGCYRAFSYEEVTAWEMNTGNPTESYLYVGKKKIPFNMLSTSSADLLTNAFDAYRKKHKGKHLPDRDDLKKGKVGFRAHVHNPGEFLAIFIMVLVFVLGIMIWIAVDGLQPVDETEGEKYTVTFSSWSVEEDALLLLSPHEEAPFKIQPFEGYLSNIEGLKDQCNGKTTFTLWAKYRAPDDTAPYYDILALFSDQESYLTFEDATAQKREGVYIVLGLFGGILLFFLLFALLIYLVGRNPEKYPKWLVYACFKKAAIDIDSCR